MRMEEMYVRMPKLLKAAITKRAKKEKKGIAEHVRIVLAKHGV